MQQVSARGGGVLHYKFIRGCAPQGFLLIPDPIPEFLSDIDTPSWNFEEVTKTIRHQRDKELRAGNDNFCPKWPLEGSSDLSTFLNKKYLISVHLKLTT